MNKSVIDLVNQSKQARLTLVPHLSDEDISRVWDAVSQNILQNYMQRKATIIKNFGTFTYVTHYHIVAQVKSLVYQQPVFVTSPKLVATHRIREPSRPYTAVHKVMPLNYTQLSMTCGIDRDSVELCVKEVAQAFNRAIRQNTNVQCLFRGIGVLCMNNLTPKMKFFKEFLRRVDRTENVMNCMEQRCIMSTQH